MAEQTVLQQLATVAQILFFVATGTLAVLTYINAKRTFFQPLRTEIFKRQVEDLSAVLKMLAGKNEVALRDEIGIEELEHVNITKMYDTYARLTFHVERPEEARPYRTALCPVSIVKPEAIRLADDSTRTDSKASKSKAVQDDVKPTKYFGDNISLPVTVVEKQDEIRVILDSPLLPMAVADMLQGYLDLIHENIMCIGSEIEDCSREMPDKYPDLDTLKRSSTAWVHNRINKKCMSLSLEAEARKINDFIRSYFGADDLLPAKTERRRWTWGVKANPDT